MAKLLKTDGTEQNITVKKGTTIGLDALQDFVGGYIDLVPSKSDKTTLVVNDEGLIMGLPINEAATKLAGMPLYGDVLQVNSREIE